MKLERVILGAPLAPVAVPSRPARPEPRHTSSEEFQRRAWERIREARQRREEEKKRGKDRDPGRER